MSDGMLHIICMFENPKQFSHPIFSTSPEKNSLDRRSLDFSSSFGQTSHPFTNYTICESHLPVLCKAKFIFTSITYKDMTQMARCLYEPYTRDKIMPSYLSIHYLIRQNPLIVWGQCHSDSLKKSVFSSQIIIISPKF